MIAPAINYTKPPVGHPYEYVAMCCTRTIDVDGEDIKIHIMLYGAYNALGLIGPEYNGIAILNDTHKAVVLDGEAAEDYGWYPGYGSPTHEQVAAFNSIAVMDEAALVDFIRAHPRYRDGSL